MHRCRHAAFALLLACFASFVSAQPSPTQRLRGTVQALEGDTLVLLERNGTTMRLALADNFGVSEVLPIEPAALQPGAYVGTAAMSGASGLNAIEVLVFPEPARGAAEGHGPWDLQPGSTMTNATVAEVVAVPSGRSMRLRYKDGEQTVVVPDGVPIVTLKPADRALLVPGAKVVVFAQQRDGKLIALRALAGRNGFAPPM